MDRARVKLGDKVMIPAVVDKIEYTTFGDNYRVEPITTWFAADDIEALKQTESEEEVDDYCNNCPYISWDSDLIKGGDAEVNETKSPYMQPCPDGADLISRQAVIEAIENHDTDNGLIGCILDLPSVDREDYEKGYKDGQLAVMTGNDEKEFERGYRMGQAADRPTGEWIPVTNGRGGHECDQCHEYAPSWATGEEHLTNFCPNCGAKMKGGDE